MKNRLQICSNEFDESLAVMLAMVRRRNTFHAIRCLSFFVLSFSFSCIFRGARVYTKEVRAMDMNCDILDSNALSKINEECYKSRKTPLYSRW